jgi:hypothetical protein
MHDTLWMDSPLVTWIEIKTWIGLVLKSEQGFGLEAEQSDQIGRIFDYWAIIYFGPFIWENYRSSQFFGLLFPAVKAMYSLWQKTGLGLTLGDFLSNPSGHPEADKWQDKTISLQTSAIYVCKRMSALASNHKTKTSKVCKKP